MHVRHIRVAHKVHKGCTKGVHVRGYHWLPLATIHLIGVNR